MPEPAMTVKEMVTISVDRIPVTDPLYETETNEGFLTTRTAPQKLTDAPEPCRECGSAERMAITGRPRIIHKEGCSLNTLCQQPTGDSVKFYRSRCLRQANGKLLNGDLACNEHLGAARKRQRDDTYWRADQEEQKLIRDETVARAAKIRKLLGIRVGVEFHWGPRGGGRYTGRVLLDPTELLPLIEEE